MSHARTVASRACRALPCVWMPLTSGLVELHLLSVRPCHATTACRFALTAPHVRFRQAAGHAAALLLLARLAEPRWGTTELLSFASPPAAPRRAELRCCFGDMCCASCTVRCAALRTRRPKRPYCCFTSTWVSSRRASSAHCAGNGRQSVRLRLRRPGVPASAKAAASEA